MKEILPCPFCGSKSLKLVDSDEYIMCLDCEALGPTAISEEDAINFWNSRNTEKTKLGDYVGQ